MSDFIREMNNLPLFVKIILALPGIDIVWCVYRIVLSAQKENILGVILGVVLLIVGIPFLWLIDIITILIYNKVFWID